MKKKNRLHLIIYIAAAVMLFSFLFTGCSSTSALKEDEQLFTGLKPIEYSNYEANTYADSVKEEMEFALASARRELLWEAAISVLRFLSAYGYGMPSLRRMMLFPDGLPRCSVRNLS